MKRSNWFPLSAALLFLIGGFGGVLECLLSVLSADIQPGRERAAVTLTHVFFCVGAIAGPALAGWVTHSPFSWRYAYTAVGLLAFLSAVWLIRYPYPIIKPEERIRAGDVGIILRNGRFLLLCGALALYVGVEMSVTAWTAKYFTSDFGYSSRSAGFVVSFFRVVMTIGRLFFTWLSLRLSNRMLIRGLSLLAGAGFILQGVSTDPAAGIISIGIIGMGMSGNKIIKLQEVYTTYEDCT